MILILFNFIYFDQGAATTVGGADKRPVQNTRRV
jgi:hypothetical protein